MKEAWLMAGAVVPVDVETTSELVAEIKRLIDVVGGMALAQQEPDWKAEYLKSVESGCITLDELREANAELAATNRQVEILSDALAESRREVAAQSAPVPMAHIVGEIDHTGKVWKPVQPAPVQEPVAWIADTKRGYNTVGYECKKVNALPHGTMLYTTPLAANRQWVGLTDEERDDFALLCGSYATVCAIEDTIKEKNI